MYYATVEYEINYRMYNLELPAEMLERTSLFYLEVEEMNCKEHN